MALEVADGLVDEGDGSGIDNGPPRLGRHVSAMDTSQADRPLRRLRPRLPFGDILLRRGEHLELLSKEAQGFGQMFFVPREGERYGRRGGYGDKLPGDGTNGLGVTMWNGMRQTRLALLIWRRMRWKCKWRQRWLLMLQLRRHWILKRNAVRRRRRRSGGNAGSTRGIVANIYVLLRLASHRSRYRCVRTIGSGVLRRGRRVSAGRRTREAFHVGLPRCTFSECTLAFVREEP